MKNLNSSALIIPDNTISPQNPCDIVKPIYKSVNPQAGNKGGYPVNYNNGELALRPCNKLRNEDLSVRLGLIDKRKISKKEPSLTRKFLNAINPYTYFKTPEMKKPYTAPYYEPLLTELNNIKSPMVLHDRRNIIRPHNIGWGYKVTRRGKKLLRKYCRHLKKRTKN